MCINATISPYAATKMAGEQLCSNYSHLYGMRCISLRLFTVYGPRQRPDLAIHKFTKNILAGARIDQFGDGSTRRDYTYVDDIVQGIRACLGYEGELCDTFNLGENQTTTLAELIEQIEKALGKKARHQPSRRSSGFRRRPAYLCEHRQGPQSPRLQSLHKNSRRHPEICRDWYLNAVKQKGRLQSIVSAAKNVVELLQALGIRIPSVNPHGDPGTAETGEAQAAAEFVRAVP